MSRRTILLATLAMALLIALSACEAPKQVNSQPSPTAPPATATISLPAGWYSAPTPGGRFFADTSGFRGLVTSPANPSEIAGCGLLPLGGDQKSTPEFLTSMDAGRHWQTHAITGASATTFCVIVADTILPRTFVLQTGVNSTNQLLVTRDNGATWQPLTISHGYTVDLYGMPGYDMPALVNGHLITYFILDEQTNDFRLYDLTLGGEFTPLDAHMPRPPKVSGLPDITPPEAFAVDPTDPSHLYALEYGAFGPNHNTGFTLYTTRNGGDSWRFLREWPTAIHLSLWVSPDKRVYALDGQDSSTGLYSSADGATWWFTSLNDGYLALSPSGFVVLFSGQKILAFDPRSNHQRQLGTVPPDLASEWTCAVVLDQPSPTLLLAGIQGVFAFPLKTVS